MVKNKPSWLRIYLGSSQVEIRCSNKQEDLQKQYLAISVTKPEKVKKRLEENGIKAGHIEADPYTGVESFSFEAPDNVTVTILGQ